MSSVPGSLFRKILFWMHLSCGVLAGLFILVMSATGVTLTYERQMTESAARRNHVEAPAGRERLTVDALADAARAAAPGQERLSLVIDANPAVPVSVSAGRQTAALLNPYTGEQIEDAATGTRGFMSKMKSWHRWLGGDSNSIGAKLIDWSNLLFVFIVASGLYLWFPAVWRWRTWRGVLLFQRKYINAKVRDFNWHHVFGIWMLVPLFLIALSGAVISFPWATNLIYAAYGEQAPQRGGGGGGAAGPAAGGERAAGGGQRAAAGERGAAAAGERSGGATAGERGAGERGNAMARGDGAGSARSGAEQTIAAGSLAPSAGVESIAPAVAEAPRPTLQQLFAVATSTVPDWQRVTLPLQLRGDHVDVQVELRSTERRPPRRTLELSTEDARVMSDSGGATAAQSPAQRARSWFRFVHTGEEYGVIGQTIAGLASLAACFLVYTGLALAWRRLIRPLFRRTA